MKQKEKLKKTKELKMKIPGIVVLRKKGKNI